MIMLDTDILVDILRKFNPALKWLSKIKDEEIIISGFVLMELIQGCKNKEEQKKLEESFNKFTIAWPSAETCKRAYLVFSKYNLSKGIGILDSIIGQIAVDLDLPLYTFNEKHYKSVPNLKTLRPYKK